MRWESLVAIAAVAALPILVRELLAALLGGAVLATALTSKHKSAAPPPAGSVRTDAAASEQRPAEGSKELLSESSDQRAGGRPNERDERAPVSAGDEPVSAGERAVGPTT